MLGDTFARLELAEIAAPLCATKEGLLLMAYSQRLSHWERTPRLRLYFAAKIDDVKRYIDQKDPNNARLVLDKMDEDLESIDFAWNERRLADQEFLSESVRSIEYWQVTMKELTDDPLTDRENEWLDVLVKLQNKQAHITRRSRLTELVFAFNEEESLIRNGVDPIASADQFARQGLVGRRLHNAIEKLGDKFLRNLPQAPNAGKWMSKEAFLKRRQYTKRRSKKRKFSLTANITGITQDHRYPLTAYFRMMLKHFTVETPLTVPLFSFLFIRHVGVTNGVASSENGKLRPYQNPAKHPEISQFDGGLEAYEAANITIKTEIQWRETLCSSCDVELDGMSSDLRVQHQSQHMPAIEGSSPDAGTGA